MLSYTYAEGNSTIRQIKEKRFIESSKKDGLKQQEEKYKDEDK